jgi:hypothetical protein
MATPIISNATYFVDPPYQKQGVYYRTGHNSKTLDFQKLAGWVKSLPNTAQVIVCEQEGADWLPFTPLPTPIRAGRKTHSREVIWTNTRDIIQTPCPNPTSPNPSIATSNS